jgi:5'-deoxynucleotidase YfbR-like HD superfamily hydrolase
MPSGVEWDLSAPLHRKIHLFDIAHATAKQDRYTGCAPKFYSVAQHARLTAELVRIWGGTLMEQRYALVHDATETYLGDIAGPLKQMGIMSGYRTMETWYQRVIARRFKLPQTTPDIVRAVDTMMVSIEVRDIWKDDPTRPVWGFSKPATKELRIRWAQPWQVARWHWLRKARQLGVT